MPSESTGAERASAELSVPGPTHTTSLRPARELSPAGALVGRMQRLPAVRGLEMLVIDITAPWPEDPEVSQARSAAILVALRAIHRGDCGAEVLETLQWQLARLRPRSPR